MINVLCLAKTGTGDRLVLHHVAQGTPPRGCYSFADGVLRLAPEDVRQYVGFIVRVWAHPAGRDTVEYEVHSSALTSNPAVCSSSSSFSS